MKLDFDLTTVPDCSGELEDEQLYVKHRSAYIGATYGIRDAIAEAIALRELGYSHSGISNIVDVNESTVSAWMDDVEERFGKRALETRPQSTPILD